MSTSGGSEGYDYAVALAEKFYVLGKDASDNRVDDRYQEFVREYHPDISDLPQEEAELNFKASDTGRELLKGDIERGDSNRINTAISLLERALDDADVEDAKEEVKSSRTQRETEEPSHDPSEGFSSSEARKSPGDFDRSNFGAVTGQERQELIKEVALGYSVLLRYSAVEPMMKEGVSQEDFYARVNEYISDSDVENLSNGDYYRAVEDIVRDEFGIGQFVGAIEELESKLQQVYGEGGSIDQIAMLIAPLVVDGRMTIGMESMQAGQGSFRRPGSGSFRRERGNDNYRNSYDRWRRR